MRLLWGLPILLQPGLALAAEASPGGVLQPSLKLLGALVVVLGLVLLLYAFGRRGLGLLPGAKGGQIQVLEMRSLGAKKGLCLVRVRNQEFLLGLGADRVELLAPLDAKASASFADTLTASLEEGACDGPSC